MIKESRHVRKSKTVLDYGFHAMDSGSRVMDSWFFVCGTCFGFQSLADSGFLELNSRLQSPVIWIQQATISRIPDSLAKICQNLESTFPYMGRRENPTNWCSYIRYVGNTACFGLRGANLHPKTIVILFYLFKRGRFISQAPRSCCP